MSNRTNTLVFVFDKNSPKVNAFHIHEWLYHTVNIREDDIHVIQIDGPLRHVYVKFVAMEKLSSILNNSEGGVPFKHDTGEITIVTVELAGMGIKRVRIAALPPEVTEQQIKHTLAQYGDIKHINDETWSQHYRFKVKSGVRTAHMSLRKHIPSYLRIEGHRALISYEGQPSTCFRCGGHDHQNSDCPRKLTTRTNQTHNTENTWASTVKNNLTTDPNQQQPQRTPPNKEPQTNTMEIDKQPTQEQKNKPQQTTHEDDKPEADKDTNYNKEATKSPTTNEETNAATNNNTQQNSAPSPLKWSDQIEDNEEELQTKDNNRKKREQENEQQNTSMDNNDTILPYTTTTSIQPKRTSSPKRTKKNENRQRNNNPTQKRKTTTSTK